MRQVSARAGSCVSLFITLALLSFHCLVFHCSFNINTQAAGQSKRRRGEGDRTLGAPVLPRTGLPCSPHAGEAQAETRVQGEPERAESGERRRSRRSLRRAPALALRGAAVQGGKAWTRVDRAVSS